MFKVLAISILFISTNSYAEKQMTTSRYSAFFTTINSNCILSVNGLDYLDTLKGSRSISTGSDITDALENNKVNSIGLLFYPSEPSIKSNVYFCEIKIVKTSLNKPDEVVTNFKITFDDHNNRSYDDPLGYSITDIIDKTGNPIVKGISNRIKFKGDAKPKDWLTAYRDFTASAIPEWKWTEATPQINNSELRNKLLESYKELINDLKDNDLTVVKKKYSLALNEYALNDFTDDTDLFFDSIGLVNAVNKGKVNLTPDWNKFKVLTYQKDRIFCLGIGGASRTSPIQFFNAEGKRIFAWNPFFAMIDGKMTLIR